MRRMHVRAGLAVLAAGLAFGCRATPPPDDLIGTWRTEAPGYEDRAMTIASDTIRFGIGEGRSTAHEVLDVREEPNETIIEYGRPRAPYRLRLDVRSDGTLVLVNQPHVVWRRSD